MNRTSQGGRDTTPSEGVRSSPPEDRYRRGTRRTAAEPLAACWQPGADRRDKSSSGIKRLAKSYGWRVYAIPVLLVLTALVVIDTAVPSRVDRPAAETSAQVVPPPSGPPAATETPPVKVDLVDIPTAVLPEGPRFSEQGAGTWGTVLGTTGQIGQGRLYRYAITIEDGIDPADYGGDRDAFARTVDSFLADPRSWVGTGTVAMQRVDNEIDADFVVSLTTTGTTHGLCGTQIQYESSCWNPATKRVVMNVARWVRGAKAFSNDLSTYRQYAINHEVGHALGNNHEGCKENGQPAPVMMQQTFGVANDYVHQLNQVDASNSGAVPADGKVCTPNAFPVAPK
ncbi:DUF3152 domain-containing protein [Saccharothrix violaceirubra]|uniref:DUF3152 domain-containing protein n=1 Tax=Saccharothrix violaceirubra TaxID=413306 RepID=A0A7W7WYJ8_9PSEU|nr:DUF3152 domain-containing protein [Saccharothrix violaceirubra]MBB4968297.1 hypothetical protein [Saccharothrix violaceirubra]